MDPVTVSIILTTVGWLVNATISKNAGDAWQKYVKLIHLQKESDNMIAELEKIKLLVEAAKSAKLPTEEVTLLDNYLKKIKELICEANDVLDELEYFRLQKEVKKMNKPKKRNTFSRLIPFGPSDVPTSSTAEAGKELKLYKRAMSDRFKDLTRKLKQAYKSLNPALTNQILGSIAGGIQTVTDQTTRINRPQTTSLGLKEIIYGRDDDKDRILKLIHSQKLPVITIVGQGGVGKTTLARLIYNETTTSFSKKIWICVSTNFDVPSITREMLEYFHNDGRRYDGNNLSNLQEILQDRLKNERALLVLDDIWEIKSKEVWDSLLAPFNPSTSTVLVTTRNPCIVNMIRTGGPNIELQGLDENSILSLFKTWTFGDDKYNIPYTLEDIATDIVEKLKGNPLAAKTVGGLLKGKADRTDWMEILTSEKWKLEKGDDFIMPVLRLSYDLLPVHLQRCFAYCSLFPEDYKFKANELVYIWMAQDFICTTGDELAEDVGHKYLQELVERAFFQPIVTYWGKEYELHDLMHDLAKSVTLEEKQYLVIDHRPQIPGNYPHFRHLSIHPGVDTIDKSIEFQNLNSLIVLEDDDKLCSGLNWNNAKRVHLRLLVLPYMWSISYNFSNFIHLRYLKLNYSIIGRKVDEEWVTIPPELCRLYHLQVLELRSTWDKIKELPKEFNNLVNLRHFFADEALHSMITGVGRLQHLQELKEFKLREEKGFELDQLSQLNELRVLQIYNLEKVKCTAEAEHANLSQKKLVTLKLSWNKETFGVKKISRTQQASQGQANSSPEDILEALRPHNKLRNICIKNYGGSTSPSWLSNPPMAYLQTITLSNCEAWNELPNFGQLMSLEELYLRKLPRVKTIGAQFYGSDMQKGFPSLKVMEVSHMAELETWFWSKLCIFPFLEQLTIKKCPKLNELPNFGQLMSLEKLYLRKLPRVKAIGAQFNGSDLQKGFISLKVMEVIDMAKLETWIWSELCIFPYLEKLTIGYCPKLRELSSYVGKLRSLKELYLISLPEVKKLELEFDENSSQVGLPSLEVMDMKYMDKLETWVWNEQYKVFPSLKRLTVKDCDQLKKFSFLNLVSVHGEDVEWFPKLSYIKISGCPQLQRISPVLYIDGITETNINVGSGCILFKRNEMLEISRMGDLVVLDQPFISMGLIRFINNVCSMTLKDCPNLTSLSWECICMLHRLKTLTLQSCPKLHLSVPAKKAKTKGTTSYTHESLEELHIHGCSVSGEELSYLLAHLPVIRILSVESCYEITSIQVPNNTSLKADAEVDKDQKQSPGSLSSLETLTIHDSPNMYIAQKGDLFGRLTSLKTVILSGCDKLVSSLTQKDQHDSTGSLSKVSALMQLTSLHTIYIDNSPTLTSLDLYPLKALRMLHLSNCRELALVTWPLNSVPCLDIYVNRCPSLVSAWSAASRKEDKDILSSMQELRIDSTSILSLPASTYLKTLQNLELYFVKDIEWAEEQQKALLCLTALKKLSLKLCLQLLSLPDNLYLHPSLEELTIHFCTSIKSLPEKGLPKSLQKIHLWSCSAELENQCSQKKEFIVDEDDFSWVRDSDKTSYRRILSSASPRFD